MRGSWNDLSAREQHLVHLYIIDGMKIEAVAQAMGISRSRVCWFINGLYRFLHVRDAVELGIWVGVRWREIEAQKRRASK